ncbi:MAG: phospholipase D-like domain-containing protein, partial [Bdellovibrionota bacterium]
LYFRAQYSNGNSEKNIFKYYPKKISPFLKIFNRRNHRKIFVIDQKIAYVGSLNVMEPALKWKETTLRIENSNDINLLMEIFECTWDWIENDVSRFKSCDFRKIIFEVENSDHIRTTQTKVLRSHYRKDYLKRIDDAKERIWLVTPYFNPPRFLLKALVAAAERGVDVRLMVPNKTDPAWFSYLSRVYYSPLIKKGLKVYEYQEGILHSKTALIDSVGIVGSGNLNYRSFYQDLELNMIVSEVSEIEALNNEFIKDMKLSKEITTKKQMKAWERAFGMFLMKFKTSF